MTKHTASNARTTVSELAIDMRLESILAFGLLTNPKAAEGHHADVDAAKSAGLRGPVAYSLHYYGQAGELMRRRFGQRWLATGALSMTFIRPVCAGDSVRILLDDRPVQKPERIEQGQEAFQVDVYNQLGEVVAAGIASVAKQIP